MAITSTLFARSVPGPCPVCGAPNSTCKASDDKEGRSGIQVASHTFDGPQWASNTPWKSKERVYEKDMQGHRVLKYGVGVSIPLLEALRQGVLEASELSQEQKDDVRAHAARDPKAKEALVQALRAKAKKPANKMIKSEQLVRKG